MRIRRTRRRAAAIAAIVGALGSVAAAPALAQTITPANVDPQSPNTAEAREAFRIGSTLAKQAQWVDALAAFERSARLRPHAVTTYNIGFCERALGRFTRAQKSLSRALAAPSNELPAELAAQARGYLAEIEPRLARAVITLTKAGARVSVDGRPLEATGGTPPTMGGDPPNSPARPAHPVLVAGTRDPGAPEPVNAGVFDLVLDPGTHVVVVSEPGAPDAVVTREFAAGATISLTLGLVRAPLAPVKPVGFSAARRAGVIVSFSLASALAIAGGTFGGLALKNKSELDGLCVPKDHCPASAQGTIDGMKTFATLSTLGIAAAAGAATVGVVLIVTGNDGGRPPKPPGPAGNDGGRPPKPPGPTATPWIGPGSLGIRGSF